MILQNIWWKIVAYVLNNISPSNIFPILFLLARFHHIISLPQPLLSDQWVEWPLTSALQAQLKMTNTWKKQKSREHLA